MKTSERLEQIMAILQERRQVTVGGLVEVFGASQETIRRDLARLAARGLLRKVHGGAVVPEHQGEGSFSARLKENGPAKRRIARAAAALFKSGDALFIDNGSTTLAFAEELATIGGVTVVTNGARIAAAMGRAPVATERHGEGNPAFLIGGTFADDGAETLGPLAIEQLRRFTAAHAVLTIGALDAARGAMNHNVEEAQIARAMIDQASALTVLADTSKLERTAVFQVCALDQIDRLVTDSAPSARMTEALTRAHVEIITTDNDQAEDRSRKRRTF